MIVMKKTFFIIFSGLIVGTLFLLSCTKDWEEMNVDPNRPTEVPATNLLGQALRYYSDNYYDAWFNMNNVSTYAGHLGKIQYIDESRYFEREGTINNAWTEMYYTAIDLENAKIIAAKSNNVNIQAAALTFQSLVFGIGTDSWRDLPVFSAIRGGQGVTNPTYATQEEIYPALLDSLKKAGDLFAEASISALGDGDFLFKGDVNKWRRFANSLRLRFAVRIADVSSVGVTHIQDVLGNLSKYPIMESNDHNAFLYWTGTAPYKEPWMEDSESRDDHALGKYLVDYMVSVNDPRLPVYAKPAESDGMYRGVVPGVEDDDLGSLKEYSRIGARFRDDAMGFTPYMRYSEVLFLIAEAAHKGHTSYMTASAAYNAAVLASMAENGVDGTAFLAANPFSEQNLYLQKWVSLFKEGHEAWAVSRRHDVPVMSPAPGTRFPGHNRPPFRFAYPTSEASLNSVNSAPYVESVTDRFWGKKMWWDTRSGVN